MKAGIFSSVSVTVLLVLTVTACTDVTAPAAPVATVTNVEVAQTAEGNTIQGNSEEAAATFDDAASRLMLSFPASESTVELKAGLVAAAASLRSGDMTAASAAIVRAGAALNFIDSKGSNPDAAAIRLVLGYGSQASAALAVERF